jgi:hypothetical protein
MRPALLALLLAACGDWVPDVGAPLVGRCVDADSDPSTAVSFSRDLQPLIMMNCAACHTPTGKTPIGLEVGRLDLSSYRTLRAGGAVSGSAIVTPGSPCESIVVQKISPAPPFGARMPLAGPPFLTDAEQQLFRDWIAEGAHDN